MKPTPIIIVYAQLVAFFACIFVAGFSLVAMATYIVLTTSFSQFTASSAFVAVSTLLLGIIGTVAMKTAWDTVFTLTTVLLDRAQ